MNMDNMLKEIRNLRDEAICYDDYTVSDPHCLCERYDRILDALEAQRAWVWNWLKVNADPKHSDGEGLAAIPQVIPNDYISDGESLDHVIDWFGTSMGLSIDAAACELHEQKEMIE